MSLQLLVLRTASREVDYRQRICEDAVRYATADKTGSLPKFQRNLKKAQNEFQRALDACRETGEEIDAQDLPRPAVENVLQA